jgi:hypothetical protein
MLGGFAPAVSAHDGDPGAYNFVRVEQLTIEQKVGAN